MVAEIGHGRNMAIGKVGNMDVIPDTGAIAGVIIVAKDRQLGPLAVCYNCDVGTRLFGMPLGSSPISPDSCTPPGLK